ncbi:MAG: FtsX-like permease family protein [Acholeplasmataceae bacterium]
MLYKSVFRHFLRRGFQVALLSFIMIMSAFIFVVISYSIRALKDPSEAYFEAYDQEDFNVTIFEQIMPFDREALDPSSLGDTVSLSELYHSDAAVFDALIGNRIAAYEETFDRTVLEERLHKDLYYDSNGIQHFMRILKDTEEVNRTYVTEGRKPEAVDEIALTENYAKANDLELGETITLHDQSYRITGFILFPDYTLGLFGSEFIINNETRTLALLADQAFRNLPEELGVTLAGRFTGEEKTQNELMDHDLPFVIQTSLTAQTFRSGAIYAEIAGSEVIGLIISLVIAAIAVLIVSIMVSRMLFEQRGAIGVLKALGYTKREIAFPYLLFVLILALPGLLIGYALGFYLASPLKELYTGVYLLPSDPVEPSLTLFFQSIGIPLIFLLLLGYFVLMRLLKEHPVELMRPPVDKKASRITGMPRLLKRLPLLKRIRHAYIWRHKGRFAVFVLGVFTAIYLILIALSMTNVFDRLFKDYYDSIDVTHIAYCESATDCTTDVYHERVLEIHNVMESEKSVTLIGIDPDNTLHPLFENGESITDELARDGVIITRSHAMEAGIDQGDRITLSYGNLSLEQDVLGVQDELGTAKIYISRTRLIDALGLPDDASNVLYTTEEPTGNFVTVIDIDDLVEQSRDMSDLMVYMSAVMTIAAMAIGIVVLVLIIVLAIEHYSYDISLFKVIGYADAEVKGIFVNSYVLYVVLISILTLPFAWLSIEAMVRFMASQYGMIFPMELSFVIILMTLLGSVLVFLSTVPITYRKITDMSLADALKIYQGVT